MVDLLNQPFTCVHCNKSFMQEKTLIAHMCERKRRVLQRDEKRVQAGFMAFNRWWQLAQGAKKLKTYEEFCDTGYYNAFVKFGSFLNNVQPLYPEKFVDYVIKSGVKLDHWCKEDLYVEYLHQYLKKEAVQDALERALTTMQEYADETNTLASFKDYFRYGNGNRICHHISTGRISPWILYNSASGVDFLSSLSEEQVMIVLPWIDPDYWNRKFRDYMADTEWVKDILSKAGL